MKLIKGAFFLLGSILLVGCKVGGDSIKNNEKNFPTEVTIKGDQFVDGQGRQVILNGINVVSKSKEEGYIFQSGPELYENFKNWGVNCIRFYISWDGLEPEPGVYNDKYLEEIDKKIAWAKANGIFVILDMHQDLYGVKFSNGAPKWATLDENKKHTTGAIWSDAYMMSEAVQTSFDNFWLNKPAPDGIGIQDHYVALWKRVAKRYAHNTTVIGYDIMNEPFPGSSALESTMILLTAYGELHHSLTGEVLSEMQLVEMWGDENKRMNALKVISNKKNYHQVFSKLFDLNKKFETTHLQSMYQKVALAIREVDQKHILFLEHSYYGNTGIESSIERVKLANGAPDPLVAYAPHGYDLVTDTDNVANASSERVEYIYEQIKKKSEQLKMPVWLGEWGAFYNNSETVIPIAKNCVGLIEKHLFGNAYWSYVKGTENLEYFKQVLVRSYPVYTNGKLISYNNNFESSSFVIEWEESKTNKSSTIIYVPHLSKLKKDIFNAFGNVKIEKSKTTDAGWIIVPATGKTVKRNMTLSFDK